MATSTIFTNISINKSDEVELFLDALEKSEKQTAEQAQNTVEFIENANIASSIISKDKKLNV